MGKPSTIRVLSDITEKQCTFCLQWKVATLANFPKLPDGRLGLHPWCRECIRIKNREKQAKLGKPVRKVLATFGAPLRVQNPLPISVTSYLNKICSTLSKESRFKAYLIQNTNNQKSYIGITERKLKQRWKQHLVSGTKGDGYLLHQAIFMDGLESFKFKFIACANTRNDLHELEKQLISQYRSVEDGYNQTRGGTNSETVGTEVVVKGQAFISYSSAARHFNVNEDNVFQRLTRHGWTVEQAFELEPPPKKEGRKTPYTVSGVVYDTFLAACTAHHLEDSAVRSRLKTGWSIAQAFGLEAPPIKGRNSGNTIVVDGKTFSSLSEAARFYDLKPHTIAKRIKSGLNVGQAFGIEAAPLKDYSGSPVVVQGAEYKSISAASRQLNLDSKLVRSRLNRGWSIEQSFENATRPAPSGEKNGHSIVVEGVTYSSRAKAAKAYNLNPKIVHKRLTKLGWTINQAFNVDTTPKKRKVI